MWRELLRPLMFPAYLTRTPRPPVQLARLQRYWLSTEAGPVPWWVLPAVGASSSRPRPAVLFAHGNAELIDDWADPLSRYAEGGVHLVLPEYRGYGPSPGRPGQPAITRDILAIVDLVSQRPDVDADRIVYHGRSIGGGVVCSVADRRPPAALILQSTFTSARAMARRFGAPARLAPDPFDNVASVKRLKNKPVLLLHGERDTLIPFRHAERLHRAAPHAELHGFAQADHNTPIHTEARFWAPIERMLGRLAES